MYIIATILRLLLHPCFKWVYKSEFNGYKEAEMYQKKIISDFRDDIYMLKKQLERYRNSENNIKEIVGSNEINYLEITDKEEIVIVSHNNSDLRDCNIFLNNLHTRYSFGCCHLSSSPMEAFHLLSLLSKAGINNVDPKDMLSICDIQCKDKNHGYGTTLLSCYSKIAKRENLKYVVGELAYVDRENHPKLERFYENIGFEVYLFPEESKGVIIKYL